MIAIDPSGDYDNDNDWVLLESGAKTGKKVDSNSVISREAAKARRQAKTQELGENGFGVPDEGNLYAADKRRRHEGTGD